jgi:hypothetical protein
MAEVIGSVTQGIPEAYQEVYEAISNEVGWMHAVWRSYRQCFAEKTNVELLNQFAPAFARIIQDAMEDDVVLSLSRLTDPASSGGGRDNLTLHRLRPLAEASRACAVVSQFDAAILQVMSCCNTVRLHRNKRIAHSDLSTALEMNKLPGFSRQSIEDALAAIRDSLNIINVHFKNGETAYEHIIVRGEADSLLSALMDASRLRELRKSAMTITDAELRSKIYDRGR